jgi:hypothetical protein
MDKFLDAFDLSELKQEDVNHLNRSVTSNEIQVVIKSLPTKESPGLIGFSVEFYQTFKEELTLMLLKLFQEILREGTQPNSFHEAVFHSFQNQTRTQ